MAFSCAYAAGLTGILAKLCLITMFVLLGGGLEDGTLLGSAFHAAGSASDLLGSLATALTIPVAIFWAGACPSDEQHASYRQPVSRPWCS